MNKNKRNEKQLDFLKLIVKRQLFLLPTELLPYPIALP